jgi:hypothetical protein
VIALIAKDAVTLAVLLLAAAGMGTLVAGSRWTLALRAALGLAVGAQVLFLLGLIGQLRVVVVVILIVVAIGGGAMRGRLMPRAYAPIFIIFVGVFALALRPPLAFDETLYHLPFVRAIAESGQLRFLPDLRFPVFPQLHELLCVPVYLLAGDTATHLVSLAEVLITAALLLEWGGALAAALFLGAPIVLQLATITHVDAALTLFVAAGFYALDRARADRGWTFALSGLFLGTACSVKYLGGYFAVAALVLALLIDRRGALKFAVAGLGAALPTTLWLVATTGNPLFPFLGSSPWRIPMSSFTIPWRVLWDVTFARGRVNFQPPFTPFLIPAIVLLIIAARRDVRSRAIAAVCGAYLIAFAFLPQDSRYLVPLLPLIAVGASLRWPRLAWLAIAPGVAYLVYRLSLPPAPVPERVALERAGSETIYVCGGEQLKYYARGRFLGDFNGPYSYARILGDAHDTATIGASLRRIDARWFLVAKRACAPPLRNGGMDLAYEDAAAELWRVYPRSASRR